MDASATSPPPASNPSPVAAPPATEPSAAAQEPALTAESAVSPNPTPSTDAPVRRPLPDRAVDIARAVALGEKRSKEERERREWRTGKKEELLARSEAAVKSGAQDQMEARRERKAFRTEIRKRNQELDADKRRRDEEDKKKKELERIRTEEKKKQDVYMKDIRMTENAKMAIQQKLNTLKAEYATDRSRAEFDHRTAAEEAQRRHAQRSLELEREGHDEKNTLDADLKTKLYELEKWRRTRMQAQESETLQQASALRTIRDLREAERKREDLRNEAYRAQKKLDGEWKERKAQVEQEIMRQRSAIDRKTKDAKIQADNDLRAALQQAENALRHRLEELAIAFNNHKRPLRIAT